MIHGGGTDSYAEKYRRMRGVKQSDLEKQRLLTDRSAYLTFLESQLERVSATCLTVVGFQSRLESLQGQVVGLEAAQANNSRRIEINAEERRARGAKKEAEKYDVNVCNELSSRVETLEALVNRMAMARENDQKTIQDLQKRVSEHETAVSRISSSTQLAATSPSSARLPQPLSLDRLDELVRRMVADRTEDAKTIRDLSRRLSKQESLASTSQSASSMEEPPSSARADVTVYATVDMLQRVEQNLDTRIAQLAAGTEVSKLGQEIAALANDISKQKSANDTALKKHAECIVDQREAINSLAKNQATAITSCRTSLQKRIDSLSSALDQQHVIVSKQNSHDQENRVVNRLESKIQKRFHTLRDDVYEKSMKQQKMLIEECAACLKLHEDRIAKHVDDCDSRFEDYEQQLKSFAGQQDGHLNSMAKNIKALTSRLQLSENISIASNRASQRILDLLEAQQKSQQSMSKQLHMIDQGIGDRVVEIVRPQIAQAILQTTLADSVLHSEDKPITVATSPHVALSTQSKASIVKPQLDPAATIHDKVSPESSFKRDMPDEIPSMYRELKQEAMKEIDRLVEGKVGVLTQEELNVLVCDSIKSHVESGVNKAATLMEERLERKLQKAAFTNENILSTTLSAPSTSLTSIGDAINNMEESLSSVKAVQNTIMDDVRDMIALELATVHRNLSSELDSKVKEKFARRSEALKTHIKHVVTDAVSRTASVLQSTMGEIHQNIDKTSNRLAVPNQEKNTAVRQNKTGCHSVSWFQGEENSQDFPRDSTESFMFSRRVHDELQQLRSDLNQAATDLKNNTLMADSMDEKTHDGDVEMLASPSVQFSVFDFEERKSKNRNKAWKSQLGSNLEDLWRLSDTQNFEGRESEDDSRILSSSSDTHDLIVKKKITKKKKKRTTAKKTKAKRKQRIAAKKKLGRGGGGALSFDPRRVAKMKMTLLRRRKL